MLSPQDLRHIFYSGPFADQGSCDVLLPLHKLLNDNLLAYSTCSISSKHEYLKLTEQIPASMNLDQANGTPEHRALACLAQSWLLEQGIESKTEQAFCGYYPDALSSDKQTVVECGHTANPEKLLQYFTQGAVAEVIQVPYPYHEDIQITGHRFSAKNGLKKAILEIQAEKKESIMTILNRPDR